MLKWTCVTACIPILIGDGEWDGQLEFYRYSIDRFGCHQESYATGNEQNKSGWWFGTFSMFPYIGNFNIPIDFHIFQRGGPTTNQKYIIDTCRNWRSHCEVKSNCPPWVVDSNRLFLHRRSQMICLDTTSNHSAGWPLWRFSVSRLEINEVFAYIYNYIYIYIVPKKQKEYR